MYILIALLLEPHLKIYNYIMPKNNYCNNDCDGVGMSTVLVVNRACCPYLQHVDLIVNGVVSLFTTCFSLLSIIIIIGYF